jgi:hypothetical protein
MGNWENVDPALAAIIENARQSAHSTDSVMLRRRFGLRFVEEITTYWRSLEGTPDRERAESTIAWTVGQVRAERAADDARLRERERTAQHEAGRRKAEEVEAAGRRAFPSFHRPGMKADPALRDAIIAHRIRHAFHWTPLRSLASIMVGGIRPRAYLAQHGIEHERHSYGWERKAEDFGNCVAVSLYPQRGMMRAATEPVILVLDPSVLGQLGAFYARGNTAGAKYDYRETSRQTSAADFHALFETADSSTLVDWQAEIWIPGGIDADQVRGIVVQDQPTHDRVESLLAARSRSVPVQVNPELNGTGMMAFEIDINFGDPSGW